MVARRKTGGSWGARGGFCVTCIHQAGGLGCQRVSGIKSTEVWRVRDWVILESGLMVWLPTGFRLVEGRG